MSDQATHWLTLNRKILRGILPASVPATPGFAAAGTTAFSGEAGGKTAWDAFASGPGVGFSVMGITGEALPSAQHLALCRALIRDAASERPDAGKVLGRVNRAVVRGAVVGAQQQAVCSLLTVAGRDLRWTSAGSVGALVARRSGEVEVLASQGPPLGVLEGFSYPTRRLELHPGEHVLMLTEATPGLLRGAADLISKRGDRPVDEALETLQRAVASALGPERHDFSAVLLRAS